MLILPILPLFLLFYTLHSSRNCFQFQCANIIFCFLFSISFTYNLSSRSQFSLSFPFFSLSISIQYFFAFLLSSSSLIPFFFTFFYPLLSSQTPLKPPISGSFPRLSPRPPPLVLISCSIPFFLNILSFSRTNAGTEWKISPSPLPGLRSLLCCIKLDRR